MAIYQYGQHIPEIHPSAYIAEEAVVIGRVVIGENVSIWPGAIIRADNDTITIGHSTNIQDGAVLHVDMGIPMLIEDSVTIGHLAMLHGCHIKSHALIGIAATVLNRAQVGSWSMVGAKALITEKQICEDHSLYLGSPAKKIRALGLTDKAQMAAGILLYRQKALKFKNQLKRIG